jgi:hypothetical protein
LGARVFPSVLFAENSGKFLYAQTGAGLLIYSIDQNSGALMLASGLLRSFAFAQGTRSRRIIRDAKGALGECQRKIDLLPSESHFADLRHRAAQVVTPILQGAYVIR